MVNLYFLIVTAVCFESAAILPSDGVSESGNINKNNKNSQIDKALTVIRRLQIAKFISDFPTDELVALEIVSEGIDSGINPI